MDRPTSPKAGSIDLGLETPFRVGAGRVDPQALQYAGESEAFRLQPQTLKVLIALHDKSGEVVTRDEIIERCWDGRIVGDDVINRCISLLRPIGGSTGDFAVETVRRSGYRLVEKHSGARRRVGNWALPGALLALLALVALTVSIRPTASSAQRTLVVSVVPFSAQPGSGAERLAADTQDAVVRILTASGVSVQLAGERESGDAAADLRISGVVSADARGAAATIRIEEPRRHVVVLSHRLQTDPEHVPDLPDRVGANLASALSWTGPLIRLDQQHPSDPAFLAQLLDEPSNAQFDSLAGYEFDQRNAPNAPDSAIAQFLLALNTGFALIALPQEQRAGAVAAALRASERARELAPDYGDAYIPPCLLRSPTFMAACEDRIRLALTKGPHAPCSTMFLSQLMNNVGRTEDAVSLATASLAGDRYVPYKMNLVIALDEAAGRSDAESAYREAERLWPDNDGQFFWRRAEGLLQRGDFKALDRFEQQVGEENFPRDYTASGPVGRALNSRSRAALTAACPKDAQGIQAIQCMVASSLMGDVDDAFLFATTLYPRVKGRTPAESDAIWLKYPFVQDTAYLTSPATAAMRRDPRFLPIADGVGLLDYWRSGRLPDFCTKAHEAVCARIARS